METFRVRDARSAATCARSFWLDDFEYRERCGQEPGTAPPKRTTDIWTPDPAIKGGFGPLFHATIANLNSEASKGFRREQLSARLVELRTLPDPRERVTEFARTLEEIVRDAGCSPARMRIRCKNKSSFRNSLRRYLREVAQLICAAAANDESCAETAIDDFFGDARNNLDVTFLVGPNPKPIRVRGNLDFIYFNRDTNRHRILDFKITSADAPSKDLLQVALYSLMHHQQHGTTADVAVVYLCGERRVCDYQWDYVHSQRKKLLDHLAMMSEWLQYSPENLGGAKPPGEPALCPDCRWLKQNICRPTFGDDPEGQRTFSPQSSECETSASMPSISP